MQSGSFFNDFDLKNDEDCIAFVRYCLSKIEGSNNDNANDYLIIEKYALALSKAALLLHNESERKLKLFLERHRN